LCTRALWSDAAGAVLVGRNMDYGVDLRTNLWAFPRGLARDNGVDDSLAWTSRYGSVAAASYDVSTADGLNEKGLAGHLNWLTESSYGARDLARPALGLAHWLQYFLDTCETVAEAVAWVEETQVQIVSGEDPGTGRPVTLHLALEDATGDSAVIEYLDGTPRVWHDRSYTVLTNSPTFAEQLELLRQVEGLGGDRPLPGGTDAPDRFARASYYLARLPEPASRTEAVAALLSVMRNAAQPFRLPAPDQPFASTTIWRTVADLTDRVYVFESTRRPNIVWVRLDGLDLAEGQPTRKLDLVGDTGLEGGLVGDVTDAFTESPPLEFMRAA
jgi:choloylglycine hydrolase